MNWELIRNECPHLSLHHPLCALLGMGSTPQLGDLVVPVIGALKQHTRSYLGGVGTIILSFHSWFMNAKSLQGYR